MTFSLTITTAEEKAEAALSAARASATNQVTACYAAALAPLTEKYPLEEREGWQEQVVAAEAVLAGGSSDLIDALAAARSIPALEMAQRIQSKRDEYRTVYIATTAHRHQLLQQIEAATDLQELQAINLDAGWPLA